LLVKSKRCRMSAMIHRRALSITSLLNVFLTVLVDKLENTHSETHVSRVVSCPDCRIVSSAWSSEVENTKKDWKRVLMLRFEVSARTCDPIYTEHAPLRVWCSCCAMEKSMVPNRSETYMHTFWNEPERRESLYWR